DLHRFAEALRAELPEVLSHEGDAAQMARRASERRTPVHLDPAMNLVEHIVRALQRERGVVFRDPPRRVEYAPGVALREGDIVVHAKLGEGEVLRLLQGKAEIRFADSVRQLVCRADST